MEIQLALGSDIMMCLDECVEYPASHEALARSVGLTTRWAKRAKEAGVRTSGHGTRDPGQTRVRDRGQAGAESTGAASPRARISQIPEPDGP